MKLALVVAVLVTGGCTDGDPDAAATPDSFAPGTITSPEGEEVDCGEYTWPSEEPGTAPFADEHRCFLDALADGTPAVLVQHSTSVEGDPIRQQLRVTAPDQLDLTNDSTLDKFGEQRVYTVSCSGAQIANGRLEPTRCEAPPEA